MMQAPPPVTRASKTSPTTSKYNKTYNGWQTGGWQGYGQSTRTGGKGYGQFWYGKSTGNKGGKGKGVKKGKGKGGGKGGKKAKGGQANSAEEAEWFYDEENDRWWRQDPMEDCEWDFEDDSDDEQAFSCIDKAFMAMEVAPTTPPPPPLPTYSPPPLPTTSPMAWHPHTPPIPPPPRCVSSPTLGQFFDNYLQWTKVP